MRRRVLWPVLLAAGLLAFWAWSCDGATRRPVVGRAPDAGPSEGSSRERAPRLAQVPLSRIEAEAAAREEAGYVVHRPVAERAPLVPAATVTVEGLLIESDGQAARGGYVRWVPIAADGTRLGSEQIRAGKDGHFSLRVAAAELVHLEASGEYALTTSFALPLPADGELGRLSLTPGCSLAGWVVAAAGSGGVEGAFVTATRCLADAGHSGQGDAALWDEMEMAGRLGRDNWGACSTDDQGRWRINGLPPGTYGVEVVSLSSPVLDGELPWSEAVLHDGVRHAHRSIVQAPALGVRLELACSWIELLPDHPGEPHSGFREVMASFTDPAGRMTELNTWFHDGWGDSEGSFAMALTPGITYRVRAWANGYHPLVFDHLAPPAGQTARVPIRLSPLPRGRLRIEPPLARSSTVSDVRVELLDRAAGERQHWELAEVGKASQAPLSLPQGAWTLVLTPWHPSGSMGSAFDLPDVRPIVVEADAELTIRWDPPQGGRFTLLLGTVDGARRPLACLVERAGTKARATLLAWDAERAMQLWSDEVETGRTYIALDAFPPGEVVLLLTAPDCEPLRLPVRITPRTITNVHATLEPRRER